MILLRPEHYARALPLLGNVGFNVYFAQAVLEHRVRGTVQVDDPACPTAAHVLHPSGMSAVVGPPENDQFVSALIAYMLDPRRRPSPIEMMQTSSPRMWAEIFACELGPRLRPRAVPAEPGRFDVVLHTRLNFRFEPAAFAQLRLPPLPPGLRLGNICDAAFRPWEGRVLPCHFWNSLEQFRAQGTAYAVLDGSQVLCVAFSSWKLDGVMELGIETAPDARQRGLATHACAALVRHAWAAGDQPVWSTRDDNVGSQALAARLGFMKSLEIPYYALARGEPGLDLNVADGEGHDRIAEVDIASHPDKPA